MRCRAGETPLCMAATMDLRSLCISVQPRGRRPQTKSALRPFLECGPSKHSRGGIRVVVREERKGGVRLQRRLSLLGFRCHFSGPPASRYFPCYAVMCHSSIGYEYEKRRSIIVSAAPTHFLWFTKFCLRLRLAMMWYSIGTVAPLASSRAACRPHPSHPARG